MSAMLLLFKKEWVQNRLLYLFPLPFAVFLSGLRLSGQIPLLPTWLLDVLSFAVPLVLAIAYGLQGFDVEEDAQTRDFLLVRPLSVWRIVGEKFFAGLSVLLPWTFLFILGARPQLLVWPQLTSVSSWVGLLLLIVVLLTYTTSFLAGLWVRGPKKLIASGALSFLAVVLFFGAWSSVNTVLWHSSLNPMISSLFFFMSAIILTVLILSSLFHAMVWILRQRPHLSEDRPFSIVLYLTVLIPSSFLVINLLHQPTFRIANFAGMEIFGLDQAYWIDDGAWQSVTQTMAVVGANNTLGIARIGEKPHIIYRAKSRTEITIHDLTWSPDGKRLAFRDGAHLFLWSPGQTSLIRLGIGSSPCWATDSNSLVFVKKRTRIKKETPQGIVYLNRFDLYKADLRRNLAEPYQTLDLDSETWFWDSDRKHYYTISSFGHFIVLSDQPRIMPLPGMKQDEVIFLSRIIKDKKTNSLFILSYATSRGNVDPENMDYSKVYIRLHRIAMPDLESHLLYESNAATYSQVIVGSDRSFWGRNGAFQVRSFMGQRGVRR